MPIHTTTVVAYTQAEAARLLGVTRQTIWLDVKSGKLTAHRSGRGTLIFAADLLDYVLQYRGGQGIPQD